MEVFESAPVTVRANATGAGYRLALWSGALLLCAGLLTLAATVWLIVAGYSSTPFSDQWEPLADLAAGKRFTSLSWLWQQHNEHRILLYRLSLLLDLKLFGGRSFLEFGLTLLCLLANWALWTAFFRKMMNAPHAIWWALAGFFAFCIFCPSQYENLYWGFQWTFVGAFFFSSASFISLTWLSTLQRPWLAVAASSLAAFLSEACLANGIITWPILWAGAHCLPLQRKHRMTCYAIGIVAIGLYLHHYHQPPAHSNPLETLLNHPAEVSQYVLTYFGFSLSKYVTFPGFAVIVLFLAAIASVYTLLRNSETRPIGIVLTMTLSFLLGTGVITALGRMKFGLAQATASRYQTGVMLCWACVFAALIIAAYQFRSWRHITGLNILGLCIILLPAGDFFPLLTLLHLRAVGLSSMGEALDRGLLDPSAQSVLGMPVPELLVQVEQGTDYLHRFGYFVGPTPLHLSDTSITRTNVSPGSCVGAFDSAIAIRRYNPGPPAVKIEGWSLSLPQLRPEQSFAVTDQSGHILAGNSIHISRPDVLAAKPGSTGEMGWRLYVPLKPDTRELRVFAINEGHACNASTVVFHTILNKGSGQALELTSPSDSNSAPVKQGQLRTDETQLWEFIPVDGSAYQIMNVATGKVLDVIARSTAEGAGVQQFDYVGGDNQKWSLRPTGDGYFQIVNKGSNKVLDVTGKSKADGATLQQDTYTAADSQKWKVTPEIQ